MPKIPAVNPSRSIEALLCLALALLAFANMGGCLIFSQEFLPPDLAMVNDLTCQIKVERSGKATLIGVAKYLEHDTFHHAPFSITIGTYRDEFSAHKDCKRWRDRVLKAQQQLEKTKEKK